MPYSQGSRVCTFPVRTLNSMAMLYSCVVALVLAYEPIDTNTIVSKDDYSKYDNCDDPGNCAAPCASPQTFHARMCDSWMCNFCTSDWCAASCKKLQAEYPTCRCKDWPDHKMTYSVSDIPPVPPDTCKNGELVGCHKFFLYADSHPAYYYFYEVCPQSVTIENYVMNGRSGFGGQGEYYYYYYDLGVQESYPENGKLVVNHGRSTTEFSFQCGDDTTKGNGQMEAGKVVSNTQSSRSNRRSIVVEGACACDE